MSVREIKDKLFIKHLRKKILFTFDKKYKRCMQLRFLFHSFIHPYVVDILLKWQ